jgi:hypothetical protein
MRVERDTRDEPALGLATRRELGHSDTSAVSCRNQSYILALFARHLGREHRHRAAELRRIAELQNW